MTVCLIEPAYDQPPEDEAVDVPAVLPAAEWVQLVADVGHSAS